MRVGVGVVCVDKEDVWRSAWFWINVNERVKDGNVENKERHDTDESNFVVFLNNEGYGGDKNCNSVLKLKVHEKMSRVKIGI